MTSCSSQPYRCQNSGDHSLKVKLSSAGMAACCADLVTFPLDTAKVRLQIQNTPQSVTKSLSRNPSKKHAGHGVPSQYRGMYGTLRTITLREGPRALYAGLGAGLQRQMCFASIRIGFYEDVKNHYQTLLGHGCDETASIFVRMVSGLTTGALSVTVAHPTDVVKVRMQAQGATGNKLYTGAFQAYREIARKEGIRGLWKGYLPNVTRNSLTNVGELVTYDIIKEKILRRSIMTDSFPCHVISGFGAGFFATLISSPVDVVKTRYMNSHPNEYNGVIDCALKMFRENGPMSFYKGFLVSFTRFGSWNIVMFVCYEQMKRTFSGKQLRGDCETIAAQEKKSTLKPQVQNRIN